MAVRRELEIGPDLRLPLSWMTMATVVYGNRGTGKSTLGRVFAEEIVNHSQRFCAIDIAGAFWGLKASASGTDTGLPIVIFGGEHADVPLETGAGAKVAEIVASISQSVVLDFELMSKGKQISFLGEFLERLYHINRDPLLLLMDEAQRYAPQKPMSVDANRTLGATEDIVKLGRKHGLGPVVFTQRGSGLNKEVSELADVLVAFRSPGVLDRQRIKEWLEANATAEQQKEVLSKLSGLPTGTAIVASNHPDLPIFGTFQIRRTLTFDSSATPKPGQRRVEPKVLAQADIEALKTEMAEAIDRAKAEDPKELRKLVAELRSELAGQELAIRRMAEEQAQVVATEIKLVPVISDDAYAKIAELAEILDAITDQLDPVGVAQPVGRRVESPKVAGSIPAPDTKPDPIQLFPPDSGVSVSYELSRSEQAILGVLGVQDGLTLKQLAFKTGYSAKSSGFGIAISNLRKLGLIEPGQPYRITAKGIENVPADIELPPPPGPGLVDYWMRKLAPAEQKLLRVMVEAHPEQLNMAEIAERAGYSVKSSGLGVAMGGLRSKKLVDGFTVSEDVIGR